CEGFDGGTANPARAARIAGRPMQSRFLPPLVALAHPVHRGHSDGASPTPPREPSADKPAAVPCQSTRLRRNGGRGLNRFVDPPNQRGADARTGPRDPPVLGRTRTRGLDRVRTQLQPPGTRVLWT